jgi:U3 small nucleolar RNA-associated protein 14
MPSDFEDEEIDEELAFTAEDKARFGSWFDEDGGLGGGHGSDSEDELFGDEGEDPLAEVVEEEQAGEEQEDLGILYSSDEEAPSRRKVTRGVYCMRLGIKTRYSTLQTCLRVALGPAGS